MPSTWLDQVPSFSGSEAEPNHLVETPNASQHSEQAENQELTPASTAAGLAGLDQTPGVRECNICRGFRPAGTNRVHAPPSIEQES